MTNTQRRIREQRRGEEKRQTKIETLIAIVVFIIFMLVAGRVGYWETHYNRDAIVINVSKQLITVEDNCGYLWDFYGDGYKVGDTVTMRMFNNGTDLNITDDEIENVKLH